jgi:hypothetical protein
MGLYLAIFGDGNELDGVEVGTYSDFSAFRNAVVNNLESGLAGSRYPTLVLHEDCDGEWTPGEAAKLEKELESIYESFRQLPPVPLSSDWKRELVKSLGIEIKSLSDCFFDVDGESLIEGLWRLSKLSQDINQPILFQ